MIIKWCTTDSICALVGVNHNVVRTDTTGKQIGMNTNRAYGDCSRPGWTRDENGPDGEELAELERVLFLREIQFDLQAR